MPLGNPSETGGLKIDIYAPREAADLVVVHDLTYLKMHNYQYVKQPPESAIMTGYCRTAQL